MNILGIETSCDETAASVVKDGRVILSNIVATSLTHHKRYGGVIPEIASRKQLEFIHSVVDQALTSAKTAWRSIRAVAVTRSPGLIGSLLVGTSYADALGFALKKPVIDVDHIKAHLYAAFLRPNGPRPYPPRPQLPAIGLIVSGGHSSLYDIENFHRFRLLGRTRDDAAGEAFDKVARILNLGYPGGPVIDRLAKQTRPDTQIRFSPARLPGTYDFSFSGTKTAVLYHHQQHHHDTNYQIEQVAAGFQDSVISILVEKSIRACLSRHRHTLVLGGGVAANSALRQKLTDAARQEGIRVYCPPLNLCMDNAAMIAGYGYHLLKNERN